MTNEQKRMLRVVAAYNDCTEEEAEKAMVEDWLVRLMENPFTPDSLELHIKKSAFKPLPETMPAPCPLPDYEAPEQPKVRKKPGRKPKTLKEFVDGTAREVRQAEKMSKDEFVDYFGGKG